MQKCLSQMCVASWSENSDTVQYVSCPDFNCIRINPKTCWCADFWALLRTNHIPEGFLIHLNICISDKFLHKHLETSAFCQVTQGSCKCGSISDRHCFLCQQKLTDTKVIFFLEDNFESYFLCYWNDYVSGADAAKDFYSEDENMSLGVGGHSNS